MGSKQYIVNGRPVSAERYARLMRLDPTRKPSKTVPLNEAYESLAAELNHIAGKDEFHFADGKLFDSRGRDVTPALVAGKDDTAAAAAIGNKVVEAVKELDEQKLRPQYYFAHRLPATRQRIDRAKAALDQFPYEFGSSARWGVGYLKLAIYELQAALVMVTGRDGNEVPKTVHDFLPDEGVGYEAPVRFAGTAVAAHAAAEYQDGQRFGEALLEVEEEASPGGEGHRDFTDPE